MAQPHRGPGRVAARRTAVALLALLTGCGSLGGEAGSAYARAGALVRLPDGRQLNLRCSGSGSPTILLESGFGASSSAWYKVQPALARTTRVCAYDRAGSGFSDPGPLPRDGGAIARDLEQALAAARIKGPFVIVGHSAGGLYARVFAARQPRDVVGLVLLDTTVERRAPRPVGDGLDGIRRRVQRCLAVSELQPQPADSDPQWSGCLPAKGDAHAREVARRPDTWRNQLSELDSIFGRTSDQVFRAAGVLRDIPLYVVTASDTAAAAPSYGFDKPQSVLVLQHQAIARAADAGSQQTVLSSHMIMFDRPDVVVSAVEEMVRASRAGRAPQPLPPAETDLPSTDELFGPPGAPIDPLRPPGGL
ncbi:alpha/beta fold hydrolase [Phenylobacterium sp. CCH9-H3]|uniref:alpha/beta fold hydrolase n=1 Tax=Phenylobacterium sp. CCH9-H3 TaxID=1768774 RepID=UPI00083A4BBF|nr:alpha/beta hydrolase [Phenylobacterium sp. CCH9-H3]